MSKHTSGPLSVHADEKRSCLTIGGEKHPVAKIYSGKWGDNYPSIRLVGPSLDLKAEAYMDQITYGEIPEEVAIDTARRLVLAYNCHDELVRALELVAKYNRGWSADPEIVPALYREADHA